MAAQLHSRHDWDFRKRVPAVGLLRDYDRVGDELDEEGVVGVHREDESFDIHAFVGDAHISAELL